MARAKSTGNGVLDEAMAALTRAQASLVANEAALSLNLTAINQTLAAINQNQTALLARMAATDAQIADTNRINSERFARIETILMEHSRILLALPDLIRDKIDFKLP